MKEKFKRCIYEWLWNASETNHWMGLIFSRDSLNQACTIYMSIIILYSDFNWLMYACMHSRPYSHSTPRGHQSKSMARGGQTASCEHPATQ